MLGAAHVLYALLKICQLLPPEMLFKQLKKHIKLRTGKAKVLAFNLQFQGRVQRAK